MLSCLGVGALCGVRWARTHPSGVEQCRATCHASGLLDSRVDAGQCLCRMPCFIPWEPAEHMERESTCPPCGDVGATSETTHVEVVP